MNQKNFINIIAMGWLQCTEGQVACSDCIINGMCAIPIADEIFLLLGHYADEAIQ